MSSRFPEADTVDSLEATPLSTIFLLRKEKWKAGKYLDGTCYVQDIHGITAELAGSPWDFQQRLTICSDPLEGDIYVQTYPVFSTDFHNWGARIDTYLYYYVPLWGECDCGAVHTEFPQLHSKWCTSQQLAIQKGVRDVQSEG